ncbi:RecQ family ATP-dependent DNA helicase [Alkalicoccobacillus plakortidis]|uniref:ATP-dependent DNA helicase RecQ n=1 Tax=Alkalicoccobacillus plakortidis TaxID=444060 RepID=A0ABT0XEJ6_9BACI|nr:ATP-dependent DNA helicase RecQ [Alkalicoccobacillus plakortidis]MCM2674297.1 ATP-dependent DNA helicase [Alkalicoccobacillus plakortidis]
MDLHKELKHWFGYSEFRMGQKDIIESLLKGQDVLAMLPTGTGKSICYQLPGFLSNGLTIVVSPLLSLMQDQVQELKSNGLKQIAALNSMVSNEERQFVLNHLHDYRLLYLSPEMLQSEYVLSKLKQTKVSFFIVDEAHCISHWGKSFRTDYRKLAPVRRALANPPCLAITATATEVVRDDIREQLQLNNVQSYIYSVDRPTIALDIKETSSNSTKLKELNEYVRSLEGPGLIYFQTRKWAEAASSYLQQQGHANVSYYHGGMVHEDRLLIQQQFMKDQLDLICCTSAFGMGVNKSNIRYVIHFQPPLDLESFLQEIGRAGRDGENSLSLLLYSAEDRQMAKTMIKKDLLDKSQLIHILSALSTGGKLTYAEEKLIYLPVNCSDTAYSVLRYQLEMENYVIRDQWQSFDVQTVYPKIEKALTEYGQVLEQRLNKIWEWIESNSCKRQQILRYFDEIMQSRPDACCSYCGLDRLELTNSKVHNQQASSFEWVDHLNYVFLKGHQQ